MAGDAPVMDLSIKSYTYLYLFPGIAAPVELMGPRLQLRSRCDELVSAFIVSKSLIYKMVINTKVVP